MDRTRYIFHLTALIGGGTTAATLLPQTYYIEKQKKALQLKINYEEVSVPKKLKILIRDVMNEIKFEGDPKLIKPFISGTLNISHVGYSGFQPGAILGIPQSFMVEDKPGLNLVSVINEHKIPPESPVAESFKKTLILSEDAKKFAIAKKILESYHPSFYPVGLSPIIITGLVNALYMAYSKKNVFHGNLVHYMFITQVLSLGVWLYIFVKDLNSSYVDLSTDFEVANCGMSYINGGVEYYEKMIKRNKLLKMIDEKAPYTEEGTEKKYIFDSFNVSLNEKLKYLNDMKLSEGTIKRPSIWRYFTINFISPFTS